MTTRQPLYSTRANIHADVREARLARMPQGHTPHTKSHHGVKTMTSHLTTSSKHIKPDTHHRPSDASDNFNTTRHYHGPEKRLEYQPPKRGSEATSSRSSASSNKHGPKGATATTCPAGESMTATKPREGYRPQRPSLIETSPQRKEGAGSWVGNEMVRTGHRTGVGERPTHWHAVTGSQTERSHNASRVLGAAETKTPLTGTRSNYSQFTTHDDHDAHPAKTRANCHMFTADKGLSSTKSEKGLTHLNVVDFGESWAPSRRQLRALAAHDPGPKHTFVAHMGVVHNDAPQYCAAQHGFGDHIDIPPDPQTGYTLWR